MEDLLRDNPSADIEQDLQRAAGEAPYDPQAPYDTQAPHDPQAPEDAGADGEAAPVARKPQVIDLHQEFRRKFPAYLRARSFLLRHRIRAHLVSGIEFQMGVFMIGPLFDVVMPATIVSGALLLVFELAIIYKLLLSTRDFTRTIDSFEEQKVPVAV